MLRSRIAVAACWCCLTILGGPVAWGQNYPNKPIRIFTNEAGSGTDFGARLVAQGISGPLGQQVIVENRSAAVVNEVVAKAAPDGYTLLDNGGGLWLLPLLQENLGWDAEKDFTPVSMTDSSPNVLAVHPSVPAKSIKELIALAKAKPGALNYARAGVGGPTHLSAELFKVMAGVNIVSVPFRGGGPAVLGILGGQVQIMFAPAATVMQHIRSGKLRGLAVTSLKPSALFPDLPTMASSGLPGYESVAMFGLFAPAGTPAAIISRLNQEIVRFLDRPDVKEKFLAAGVESMGSSPEQFAAAVKSEVVKWGKVIKDAGIRAD